MCSNDERSKPHNYPSYGAPSPSTRFAAGVKGISTETMPVPRPTISSIVLRVSWRNQNAQPGSTREVHSTRTHGHVLDCHVELLQDFSGWPTGVGHNTHQEHLSSNIVVAKTA